MPPPDDAAHLLPTLRARCAELGVALAPEQIRRLHRYLELLLERRGRVNLTGIREPAQAERLLLLESIAAVVAIPLLSASPPTPAGKAAPRLLDIGTGGGIPGIPLAIAFPRLSVTLLDATRKKVDFLRLAVQSLPLDNVEALWGRAENLAHAAEQREQYDLVTVRGVGSLATIAELALPFCKRGGLLAAYKSLATASQTPLDVELREAEHALHALGGCDARVTPFNLPELPPQHCLVTVRKTAGTPPPYPRRPGLPAKRPLRQPQPG